MGLGRLASAPRPGSGGAAPGERRRAGLHRRFDDLVQARSATQRRRTARRRLPVARTPRRCRPAAALPLAQRLGELNTARQDLEARALREALAMVPDPLPAALVLSSPDWHEGVVGIVAARVADRLNRPAILLTEGDATAKGSGRSIPAFDLLAAVESCSGSLLGFGGHRAACGLRLRRDDIERFRSALRRAPRRSSPPTTCAADRVDAVVAGDDLTLTTGRRAGAVRAARRRQPPRHAASAGAEIRRPRLTRGGKHLQCGVRLTA